MAHVDEQTILLVSNDAALCTAARREFESKQGGVRVAAVSTMDAACRVVEDAGPAVILLEESSVTQERDRSAGKFPHLSSAVSALAVYAPVVVMGAADHEVQLSALLAAGAADFVPQGSGSIPLALGLLERRLQQSRQIAGTAQLLAAESTSKGEPFGEVLRHELNNPLTGILGNAELLLAELRRKNDGTLPKGGQERLETIAGLAVRLRETVRRLSQDWDTHHHSA